MAKPDPWEERFERLMALVERVVGTNHTPEIHIHVGAPNPGVEHALKRRRRAMEESPDVPSPSTQPRPWVS